MSSSPTLKSQPLHNFPLRGLKWGMNHTHNHHHRLRRHSNSSHKSPQRGGSDSESDNHPKNGASSSSSPDHRAEQPEKKVINGSDVSVDPSNGKSKICIRLRWNNHRFVDEVADTGDENLDDEFVDGLVPKTWNLRPRKPISKPPNQNGGALKIGTSADENKTHRPESTRSRNVTESKAAEKKEKNQKLSISLTAEEIYDDIYAMTGSRASRKPKKRAKHVQTELDRLYPGLWLASITPDYYTVPAAPIKD
ncbi:uncharacterized protein LOC111288452 isoform X1 [Durio zibethinus]|uniref:Uncharacterized protein LOC111288452 isoform X1 n=1 Tax=Durio zibethinus TaxID=66656 RepID=A0A6P5Y3T5_DURZI|nr:uncharacterized protein LOC111288452 isoform X1 [Durio zibethinus]XP_022735082.1 uncharacterized protein LOC111288452 isoform X1 [Durio zibethinus]XP_022735083.1 uncharacterized protein LOC111288452 isoform X1 [Durio zibethinus]XP_022735084.1 uncharacterized protein LOC111288452 isoform X1 [Durio zibethinus]XP_022735085.1 uncharacterized protein LOC111288452 isoform X1 [Durio zibethinus]